MTDDCRWRAGGGAVRAESEADRLIRALGGRLGIGGPAPAWFIAMEFCTQLTCDGRLGRLSDGVSLLPVASRNVLRDCVRRFRDGTRSVSRREPAGKKWAMSYSNRTRALSW
jgi:hypothetical protein